MYQFWQIYLQPREIDISTQQKKYINFDKSNSNKIQQEQWRTDLLTDKTRQWWGLIKIDMKTEFLSSRKSVFHCSSKVDNVLNGFNATVFAYGATGHYLVHDKFIFFMKNQISYWWEINFLVDEKSILNVDVVRGRWRENLYDGRPAGNLVYLFLLPSYVLYICHRT